MKNLILLLPFLIILSCKKKDTTTNEPDIKTTIIEGDYDVAFSNYVNYTCPSTLLYTSSNVYSTNDNDGSTIRFDNDKIYSVYSTTSSEFGVYTDDYIVFNSNPSDTFFISVLNSNTLIAESKAPSPCIDWVSVRYTFER